MEKIEWLNLEIYDRTIKNTKINNEFQHTCYLNKEYTHQIHRENSQINSLVDIVIFFSKWLKWSIERNIRVMETIAKLIGEKNVIVKEIKENQQYTKDQISIMS